MRRNRQHRIITDIVHSLRQSRKDKGLTHQAVAQKAKVSRSTISHIESHNRKPSLLVSLKIAESLGIKLTELLSIMERRNK